MSSILDLLDEEDQSDMPAWNAIPDRIRITQGAMEKALLIYDLVEKKFGDSRESYGGPLIDFNDSQAVIRDIVLPKKQLVKKNFIRLKPEGVQAIGQEAVELSKERGRRLVNAGWWHTHSKDIGALNPSQEDDKNSALVLNDVSRNTLFYYHDAWKEFFDAKPHLDEEDKLTLLIKATAVDPRIKIKLSDLTSEEDIDRVKRALDSASFDVWRIFEVGFSYTLITSARGVKPYGEVHVHMRNPLSNATRQASDVVDVEVVSVDNDIIVEQDKLEAMINERMEEEKIPERKLRTRRSWNGGFWRGIVSRRTGIVYFQTSECEDDDIYVTKTPEAENFEQAPPKDVDESSSIDACLKRNCARFILACYDYVLHEGDSNCRYSSYVRRMILNLNNEDVETFGDLVKLTGDISEVKDSKEIELNRTGFYLSTLVDISDAKTLGLQLKLMEEFVQSRTLDERNAVLEKYVPLFSCVGGADGG